MGNPQYPEDDVICGEQEKIFNQLASIQQPPIPVKQTASLFPVESYDNQRELIHSSIGDLPPLPYSNLITTPNTPLIKPTSATARPNDSFFNPFNSKTEGQSVQCFAFDFQNTLLHNSSADKTKTNQTSNAFSEYEPILQNQCHSEKGRNTTTKITVPNPQLF